jgi:hypothetical protein
MYFSNILKAIKSLTWSGANCHIQTFPGEWWNLAEVIMKNTETVEADRTFTEFRRKVKEANILSAAMEKLLGAVGFSGRLSIVVQNGKVLKSGYEEGYFTRRQEERLIL